MKHDACRATKAFRYPGQNLYWSGTTGPYPDCKKVLENAFNGWIGEARYATFAAINKCCGGNVGGQVIGHFTQVAKNSVIRIGCAMARYTTSRFKNSLVACNYSYGNMVNEPVYRIGIPGRACKKGRNSTYKSLCNV